MKTVMCFFLLALIFFRANMNGYCQQPGWDWAIKPNGPNVDEKCVATDASGNIYVAGRFLTKFTPAGSMIWTVDLMTGNGQVIVNGITTDALGNIYLAGHFFQTAIFGVRALTSYGHSDIFIAKFSPGGQALWARHAGSVGPPPFPLPALVTDGAIGISVDAAGNSYIAGQYGLQAATFDQIQMPAPAGGYQYFVAKYDALGQVQWVRVVAENPLNVAAGQNGSYFVAGRGQSEIFIEKYNALGTLEWQRDVGTITYGHASGLCVDFSGNAYLAGTMEGPATFGPYTLTGNIFVVKYDSAGSVLWARTNQVSAGSYKCSAGHAALNNAGHLFVTGFFDDSVSFGGNSQLLTASPGGSDIYVARFSALTGATDWAIQAVGPGQDAGLGIAAFPNGDCTVSGTFQNSCAFGNVVLTSSSTGSTHFLARLSVNPLGVSETETGNAFNIFPNPAATFITLKAAFFKQGLVSVYNATGQKVYEAESETEMRIQVSTWPVGIYAIKIISNGKTVTQKLIIVR